jgi:hypothetical protein
VSAYWGAVAISLKPSDPLHTLPVTLKNFTAQYEKAKVKLQWETSQETDFSHYMIERSDDGKDFTAINMVFSTVINNGGAVYHYEDMIAGRTGLIYYRLKLVDMNGKFSYSPTRIIRITADREAASLKTYPNPVKTELRITLPQQWQGKPVQLELYDSQGNKVRSVALLNGNQTETLDLSLLNRGVFYLKAVSGEETSVQKILKN